MLSLIPATALAITLVQPAVTERGTVSLSRPRPAALTTMYVAFAGLQALDVHSTLRAVSNGGREANPAMKAATNHPAALIGVKALAGATTIWMSEKMRKKHPRGAVVLMAALNSVVTAVVAHNYRVPVR